MNFRNIIAVPLLTITISFTAYAAGVKTPSKTTISSGGEVSIKIKSKEINNLIESTGGSNTARVRLGYIKGSQINGKVKMENFNVGTINNKILGNAVNGTAEVKVGVIENSIVQDVTMNIKTKNINNIINGGRNNTAKVHIGRIYNTIANKGGNITIDVDVRKDIDNGVKGTGDGNTAILELGSISNADIKGKVKLDVKVNGTLINETSEGAGDGNSAIAKLGVIDGTDKLRADVKQADISVITNGNIVNKVSGGDNNNAILDMGVIRSSTVTGKADIRVKTNGLITNEVSSTGEKNTALLQIGAITAGFDKDGKQVRSVINKADISVTTHGALKNIISGGGDENNAIMRLGVISGSTVDDARISVTTTKDVTNRINAGNNNTAMISMGTIESSNVKKADINVSVDGTITNEIVAGHKNQAYIRVGGIRNVTATGDINIDVEVAGAIKNYIKGGNNNIAEVSVGFIE